MRGGSALGFVGDSLPLSDLLLPAVPEGRRPVNVLADAETLEVRGDVSPTRYEHETEPVITSFCPRCGTSLFLEILGWPQWVYPFASAIDTPLPIPPHFIHVRTGERPAWVPTIGSLDDPSFETNTDESMAEWHQRQGLQTSD